MYGVSFVLSWGDLQRPYSQGSYNPFYICKYRFSKFSVSALWMNPPLWPLLLALMCPAPMDTDPSYLSPCAQSPETLCFALVCRVPLNTCNSAYMPSCAWPIWTLWSFLFALMPAPMIPPHIPENCPLGPQTHFHGILHLYSVKFSCSLLYISPLPRAWISKVHKNAWLHV